MINLFFAIYSALVAVVVAMLLVVMAMSWLRARRRWSCDAALHSKYLRIVMLALTNGETEAPRFPLLRRAGARLLLAETVARVVDVTYGLDTEVLRRIVVRYRLDDTLRRRIRFTQGYNRARYLALLGRLPGGSVEGLERYARSRNRYVRFYTLLAQLSADPAASLNRIAEFPYPLSVCEVAEIMILLRRGMLPIAYGPLVASPNRNLRAVGLGIVRQFGIEEAEKHLLRMVADDTPELGREALYALCSMRCSLSRRVVAGRIASMNAAERKALLRHMAFEGYAPGRLLRLFDPCEQPYYESLAQSYKRRLA